MFNWNWNTTELKISNKNNLARFFSRIETSPSLRSQLRLCFFSGFQLPCTEDVLPCEDTCGKLLECGSHYCHRRCHFGPCETCRQIVTKKCRCGKRSKEIPCCQVLTCDVKCNKLRNCERHPCKKKVVDSFHKYIYKKQLNSLLLANIRAQNWLVC